MSNIVKEYESRIMLTSDEYMNIVSLYMKKCPNTPFLQIVNIYFDSDDLFLRRNHITFRLRTTNDVSAELTIKIRGNNGDQEINDDLSKKEMDLLLNEGIYPEGEVKKFLLSLPKPLKEYKRITSLYNRRLEIKQDNHLLVIDKNTYSDIVDYDLEIESSSMEESNKALDKYVKEFNLSLQNKKYVGKAHRAITSIIKLD